jgi:hypothetical protein
MMFSEDFDPLELMFSMQYGEIPKLDLGLGNSEESRAMANSQQFTTTPGADTVLSEASVDPEVSEEASDHYQESSSSSQGSSVWGGIQVDAEFLKATNSASGVFADTPLLADLGANTDAIGDLQQDLDPELQALLDAAPPIDAAQSPCVDPAHTSLKPLKSFTDAVIVALGVCGVGLGQDILNVVKAHSLNEKLCAKSWSQFAGPFCNVLNSDRIVYRRQQQNLVKDESARMFVVEAITQANGLSAKRVWLTPLGRTTACTLVGLPSNDAVSKHCLSFSAAMQSILAASPILTCDEIVRIFREEQYCTFLRYWSNPNTAGAEPGTLDEARLRGLIGQYMVKHFGTLNDAGASTVCTANGYYWLAKNGYSALVEKLEQLNPYPHLGMRVFSELVIFRIESRRAINISEDKLKRKKTDAYDSYLDCVPLLITPEYEENFFEERDSSISGAGLGLWEKEGIDLPIDVFVAVRGTKRLGDPDSTAWGSHTFSAEDPRTGEFYTIDALQSDNSVACMAARMNDSRDGAQQFQLAESVPMPDGSFATFLRSSRRIKGGEELFFNYGPEYWTGAEVQPAGPASFPASGSPCKKRNVSDSETPEPISKRQRNASYIDLPPPLFAFDMLGNEIDEF